MKNTMKHLQASNKDLISKVFFYEWFISASLDFHSLYALYQIDVVNTSRTDATYHKMNITHINVMPNTMKVIVIKICELNNPMINHASTGNIRNTAKFIITLRFMINMST